MNKLKISDIFQDAQFVIREKDNRVIGMFYRDQFWGLSEIFAHPKLHNIYHGFKKQTAGR